MKDIYKVTILSLITFMIFSCSQSHKEESNNKELIKSPAIYDSVFFSRFGGYGYDIIVDGRVAIHQPHIPVIGWQVGFASAGDARKTAQFVITKIKQNHFPPQVTKKELKELGIAR
jgi:hypothetical protein